MYSIQNIGLFLQREKLTAEEQAKIIARATEKAQDQIIRFDDLDYILGDHAQVFREQTTKDDLHQDIAKAELTKFFSKNIK